MASSSSSSQDHQVLPQEPEPSTSSPPAQAGMTADEESTPPLSKPAAGVHPEFPAQGSSSSARAYPNIHPPDNMRFPGMFDPLSGGILDQAGSCVPMVPILCPLLFPGLPGQVDERQLRNAGIFAVPMVPVIGPFPGYPPSGLIPISHNFPQNAPSPGNINNSAASQPGERGAQAQEAAALGPLQDAGLHFPAPAAAAAAAQAGQALMPEGQRQVVRRFHVAFQIDLLLILKLVVVVFIFNQDGSKDRLLLLLFLAGIIYLYQTGALTPLLRWISQSAQRAMLPPQQQQPVRAVPADAQLRGQAQGENAAAAAAAANGAAPAATGGAAPVVADNQARAAPGGGAGIAADNPAGEHVQQQQAPAAQGAPWWGFLKEVQMLVVGFVTSLLPGFHQHMD